MASLGNVANALEWVITSPFLLKEGAMPPLWSLPESRTLVEETRRDPAPLQNYLQTRKRKNLGSLFEYLVFYWLKKLPSVTLLGHNLQLRDDKNTYGEIDVLFRFEAQVYHWELAIKFYACDGTPTDEANWLGPLRRDNLKRKLDHLLDVQLHHLGAPYAKSLLNDLDLTTDDIRAYPFVKGSLYTPYDAATVILPPRLSKDGLHERWLPLSRLDGFLGEQKPTDFAILGKPDWLSPSPAGNWRKVTDHHPFQDLKTLFETDPTPRKIAFAKEGKEFTRPFIMPDSWQNLPRI